jgi:hypothetical protein
MRPEAQYQQKMSLQMQIYRLIPLSIAVYLVGCAGATTSETYKHELEAAYHINIADSLLVKSILRKATNEYLLIAKQYATTKYYPEAVRKIAMLYCNPRNSLANDSISLYWYHRYLMLQISNEEKENANLCIMLLERNKLLHDELQKLKEVDVQMNKKEIK